MFVSIRVALLVIYNFITDQKLHITSIKYCLNYQVLVQYTHFFISNLPYFRLFLVQSIEIAQFWENIAQFFIWPILGLNYFFVKNQKITWQNYKS